MQAATQQSAQHASGTYTRIMAAFGTLVALALIAIALVYAVIVIGGVVAPKTTSTNAVVSTEAMLDFRAGERAALVDTQSSTSLENAFRAGERGDGAVSATQLNAQFRAGERGDATVSTTALQNQFRAGERGDDTPSAAQLNAQFRAGERGDTANR